MININKIALVTGATHGIGRAIAVALAGESYDLILVARNANELAELKADIGQIYGVMVLTIPADVAIAEDRQRIISQAAEIDILINNVGQYIGGSVLNTSIMDFQSQINTNALSALHLSQGLCDTLAVSECAHIINIGSVAATNLNPETAAYCLSKQLMLEISRLLQKELQPKGIKVTSILPGATQSRSWEGIDTSQMLLMPADAVANAVMYAINAPKDVLIEEVVVRPFG